MADLTIYLKGRNELGFGSIHYGLNVSFPLEHHRTNAENDSNAASGGTTVTPYAGYEASLGRHTFGAKVGYDVYKSDRHYDSAFAGVYARSGGQAFDGALFYEFAMNHWVTFGVTATLNVAQGTSTTFPGESASDDHNGTTSTGLMLYVPYHPTDNITLIASLPAGGYTQDAAPTSTPSA